MTWKETRLKHLCVDSGQYGLNISAENYSTSGTRLIRTSDIASDGSLKGAETGVFVNASIEARHQLQPGDILLSRSGTLGRSFLVPKQAQGHTFAGFLIRFRPKPEVDPRFLNYTTQSAAFQGTVHAEAVTSTIQNFNADRYANISMRAPSSAQQRRIAEFLDAETTRINSLIRARSSQISVLEERLETVRDSLFGGEGVDYKSTPLMYLTDPYRPIVYGIVQAGPDFPGGVPYIKTGDLKGLDPDSLSRTSPAIHQQFRRAAVHPGDMVMAMRASIGAVAIVPPELPEANLTQGTARIAVADGVNKEWLFHALQTRWVREQCDLRAVGSTFRTLNIWDVRRISITAAPADKQKEMVRQFKTVEDQLTILQQAAKRQIALLAERRQALITAAVTGQFDVSTASGRNLTDNLPEGVTS